MVIAKIKVDGVSAVATELSQIPKGIQGATIEVTYDGAWGSLNKTAVFSGSVVKDVVNAGAVISVPPETVAESGHHLRVGFYGVDGENKMIIPTLWVDLGEILRAADPSGDTSTKPSLPVWAQLQAEIEALKEAGGIKGEKGDPGYTPVKGVDYWTQEDKTEMVSAVLSSLPKYNGEVESV